MDQVAHEEALGLLRSELSRSQGRLNGRKRRRVEDAIRSLESGVDTSPAKEVLERMARRQGVEANFDVMSGGYHNAMTSAARRQRARELRALAEQL